MSTHPESAKVDLGGKVALVTGGGRGLGRAFAQALADAGARLAVTAKTDEIVRDDLHTLQLRR